MTPGIVAAWTGDRTPGGPLGRPQADPIELVADRVGPDKDEATRERAVRLVLHVKDACWPNEHPRREHDVHRATFDAWLAAAAGSPERARCEAKARAASGTTDYAMILLRVLAGCEEPGRVAAASVAWLAREGQVGSLWPSSLARMLDAAGFKP